MAETVTEEPVTVAAAPVGHGASAETGGTKTAASLEAAAGGRAAYADGDGADEYEPDFEEDTDAGTQQGNAGDGESAADASGGSEEEPDGKRAAVAKEVTWEEGPEQKAHSLKPRVPPPAEAKEGRQREASRAVQKKACPPPAQVSSPPKPKKLESMRNHMRGTLASFRTAAQTSDYDPNQTGILQQKMKKPEPVHPCRSLSQLRMWTGRPPVLPGGGGGSWIASQASIAASDEGAKSLLIDSPEAPSSPSRELLRSPVSSVRGFVPKRLKPKPPTSGDLARLSMYLTAQQHNKLKQHIQQMDRAASLALLYAQHAQASA